MIQGIFALGSGDVQSVSCTTPYCDGSNMEYARHIHYFSPHDSNAYCLDVATTLGYPSSVVCSGSYLACTGDLTYNDQFWYHSHYGTAGTCGITVSSTPIVNGDCKAAANRFCTGDTMFFDHYHTYTGTYEGDNSATCCTKCGSWAIGGEADGTTCCGDDVSENINHELAYSETIAWVNGENACCSHASDCVYGATCYNAEAAGTTDTGLGTGNDQAAHCYDSSGTGKWLECDQSDFMDYWCGNVCGPKKGVSSPRTSVADPDWNAVASGESGGNGEYTSVEYLNGDLECCGDDVNEYYSSRNEYSSWTDQFDWNDDASDDACCGADLKCVYDGKCYPEYYFDLNGDGRSEAHCYPTNNGWLNTDYHQSYCEAASPHYHWNVSYGDATGDGYVPENGNTASTLYCNGQRVAIGVGFDSSINCCCGDDSNEEYIDSISKGDSVGTVVSEPACCDTSNSCIADNTCYQSGEAYDADGDGDDDVCANGVWFDCGSDSYCPEERFHCDTGTGVCTSCYCPVEGNNWIIDMSENCDIEFNCELGGGNISYVNTGWTKLNSKINTSNIFNLLGDMIIYILPNLDLRVG